MTMPQLKTKIEPTKPAIYLSLKSGKANKSGQRSQGYIHYRVLTDPDQHLLYLTITSNDGGGYFSKEVVPFDRVEQCLHGVNINTPITSKLFKNSFIGQSANNAGFLTAILSAEKLIAKVEGVAHQFLIQPEWSSWKTEMLNAVAKAKSYVPELAKPRVSKKAVIQEPTHDQDQVSKTDSQVSESASLNEESPELDDEEMALLQRITISTDIVYQDGEIADPGSTAVMLDNNESRKERNGKRQQPRLSGDMP
jgi:hypothetical protein